MPNGDPLTPEFINQTIATRFGLSSVPQLICEIPEDPSPIRQVIVQSANQSEVRITLDQFRVALSKWPKEFSDMPLPVYRNFLMENVFRGACVFQRIKYLGGARYDHHDWTVADYVGVQVDTDLESQCYVRANHTLLTLLGS